MEPTTKKLIFAVIIILLIICCIKMRASTTEHAVSDIEKQLLTNKLNRLKKDLKENVMHSIQKKHEYHGSNVWNRKYITEELKELELKKQFIVDEMSATKSKLMRL